MLYEVITEGCDDRLPECVQRRIELIGLAEQVCGAFELSGLVGDVALPEQRDRALPIALRVIGCTRSGAADRSQRGDDVV